MNDIQVLVLGYLVDPLWKIPDLINQYCKPSKHERKLYMNKASCHPRGYRYLNKSAPTKYSNSNPKAISETMEEIRHGTFPIEYLEQLIRNPACVPGTPLMDCVEDIMNNYDPTMTSGIIHCYLQESNNLDLITKYTRLYPDTYKIALNSNKNPNVIKYLSTNPDEIALQFLVENPSAISLIKANLANINDRTIQKGLSSNPSDEIIPIIRSNPEKYLCLANAIGNPNPNFLEFTAHVLKPEVISYNHLRILASNSADYAVDILFDIWKTHPEKILNPKIIFELTMNSNPRIINLSHQMISEKGKLKMCDPYINPYVSDGEQYYIPNSRTDPLGRIAIFNPYFLSKNQTGYLLRKILKILPFYLFNPLSEWEN